MKINELLQELNVDKIVKYFHKVEVLVNNRIFLASAGKVEEKTKRGSWSYEKKEERL